MKGKDRMRMMISRSNSNNFPYFFSSDCARARGRLRSACHLRFGRGVRAGTARRKHLLDRTVRAGSAPVPGSGRDAAENDRHPGVALAVRQAARPHGRPVRATGAQQRTGRVGHGDRDGRTVDAASKEVSWRIPTVD